MMPFPYANAGGSVYSASELAKALLAQGHTVIALSKEKARTSQVLESVGVTVDVSSKPNVSQKIGKKLLSYRLFNFFTELAYAIRKLIQHKPDIVHINEEKYLLPWGVAAKLLRVPCVWHIRNPAKRRGDWLKKSLCSYMIYVSGCVSMRLADFKRGRVVYNPVERLRSVPGAFSSSSGPVGKSFNLLYIGRNIPRKRPSWVVKAYKDMVLLGSDVRLKVAGSFSEKERIDLLRDVGQEYLFGVEFVGWVSDPSEVYEWADVLLHPAVDEAFGRTIVEAAGFGVPSIAAKQCGPKEIIDHNVNGVLFAPFSYTAFLDEIRSLENDVDRFKFISRNAMIMADEYSANKHVKEVLSVYHLVLKSEH